MRHEEEEISRQFRQLREEDERNVPSFADVWNAALSRQGVPGRHWITWCLAAAAVMIAIGAVSWMYLRQPAIQQARVEVVKSDTPVPDDATKQQAPIRIVRSD